MEAHHQTLVTYMTTLNQQDPAMPGDLLETGKIYPVIERTCKLSGALRLSAFAIKATLAAK